MYVHTIIRIIKVVKVVSYARVPHIAGRVNHAHLCSRMRAASFRINKYGKRMKLLYSKLLAPSDCVLSSVIIIILAIAILELSD